MAIKMLHLHEMKSAEEWILFIYPVFFTLFLVILHGVGGHARAFLGITGGRKSASEALFRHAEDETFALVISWFISWSIMRLADQQEGLGGKAISYQILSSMQIQDEHSVLHDIESQPQV